MDIAGKTINFLGDSITYGYGIHSPRQRFTDLIAAEQGAVCNNYGVSGTRIARQATPSGDPECDRHFLTRVSGMDPRADIVIVFGGTNDFGHGDAPLGTMDDRTEDTFYGGLHLLMLALLERYPLGRIVFLTPLHRLEECSPRGDGSKQADGPLLETYVRIIREVAEYYAIPVLDLYAMSGLQPRVAAIQAAYMPDGLHPNEAGHRRLADIITAFLRSL